MLSAFACGLNRSIIGFGLSRQAYVAFKLAEIQTDTWLAGTAPIAPVIGAFLLGIFVLC